MTAPSHSSDRAPVFLFGALRSGTTVFRLMLNAHDKIGNPGEMDFLFDYLDRDPNHATGWRYRVADLENSRIFRATGLTITPGCEGLDLLESFLDQLQERQPGKLLSINLHRNIGRVADVLPRARIIHMLRDPRDVARSSIGMGWAGTLYHGVEHWIGTERDWDATAPRFPADQVLTLTYEDLFRDIDTTLRRVCDFLGVPFTEAMLSYHENTTYSPPDVSLVEQWRRKSTPRELALVEGRVQAMMLARGYQPTGPGAAPGVVERLALTLQNKRHVWGVGISRFGARIFLMEKLARKLGLRGLHQRLRAQMNEMSVEYLK
ncbi:sulfotransferase family protein [Actibacterium sp. XHP0104]|uniref:sulfotransferase family protein n=1 Tax=Actibacterium sp. XHP0104 TaxID=2984335 RepID=UPI0021E8D863|nr:sulfotransferase [Actibacterium sp. XHP0104]MCV2881857.1 sulfotransferase [Actibacterium sp. XHP0104]